MYSGFCFFFSIYMRALKKKKKRFNVNKVFCLGVLYFLVIGCLASKFCKQIRVERKKKMCL